MAVKHAEVVTGDPDPTKKINQNEWNADHVIDDGSFTIAKTTGLQTALDAKSALGHTHAAADVTTGVFPVARLATGTPDGTKFIRDDGTLATPAGEANTASNVGTIGVGIFKQKTGVNLEFKKLNAGSTKVTITDDVANSEVDVDVAVGTTSSTVCVGNDSRLSDSRTPLAHATSHKTGGSDAIKLDELAAPTDVTTLDATGTAHGLMPKTDKIKLDTVATGATANDTDANLKNRANHTGTQTRSTISDFLPNVVTKTAAATLADSEEIILIDASSEFTLTLLAASTRSGKRYLLKNIGTKGYVTTIDANGTELIDDSQTQKIEHQNEIMEIMCDGTKWHIIKWNRNPNSLSEFEIWDDFIGGGNEAGEYSDLFPIATGTGSVSITSLAAELDHPGILNILTGATSGNVIMLGNTTGNGIGLLDPTKKWSAIFMVKIPTITSITIRAGLTANTQDSNYETSHNASFLFDPATSANWRCRTRASADATTTTSIVANANQWYKLKITFDGTTVRFFIDDVFVASDATQVPTNKLQSCLGVKTNEAVAKNLYCDYALIRVSGLVR